MVVGRLGHAKKWGDFVGHSQTCLEEISTFISPIFQTVYGRTILQLCTEIPSLNLLLTSIDRKFLLNSRSFQQHVKIESILNSKEEEITLYCEVAGALASESEVLSQQTLLSALLPVMGEPVARQQGCLLHAVAQNTRFCGGHHVGGRHLVIFLLGIHSIFQYPSFLGGKCLLLILMPCSLGLIDSIPQLQDSAQASPQPFGEFYSTG